MAEARDWKLVFSCPACKRDSGLAAINLGAIVRCPHCRTSVVVERDGICKAAGRIHRSQKQLESRYKRETSVPESVHNSAFAGWAFVTLFLVSGISILTLLPWSYRHAAEENGPLRAAVEEFQSAWLAGNMDAARHRVILHDRARLEEWSGPRRAALIAGFGPKLRSQITAIEIEERTQDRVVIRVAFKIQGTVQQSFQNWKREEGQWRMMLNLELP